MWALIELILGILGIVLAVYYQQKSSKSDKELKKAVDDLWKAQIKANSNEQVLNSWIDAQFEKQDDEHLRRDGRGRIERGSDGLFSYNPGREYRADKTRYPVEVDLVDVPPREGPYIIPEIPHAIECPYCGNVQSPNSSTCSACGKEFDWDAAYHLYLLHRDQKLTNPVGID